MAAFIPPTYTPWEKIRKPIGCSLCGALISMSMHDKHTEYHRVQHQESEAQAAMSAKVDKDGLLVVKLAGLLGIKVT